MQQSHALLAIAKLLVSHTWIILGLHSCRALDWLSVGFRVRCTVSRCEFGKVSVMFRANALVPGGVIVGIVVIVLVIMARRRRCEWNGAGLARPLVMRADADADVACAAPRRMGLACQFERCNVAYTTLRLHSRVINPVNPSERRARGGCVACAR